MQLRARNFFQSKRAMGDGVNVRKIKNPLLIVAGFKLARPGIRRPNKMGLTISLNYSFQCIEI